MKVERYDACCNGPSSKDLLLVVRLCFTEMKEVETVTFVVN